MAEESRLTSAFLRWGWLTPLALPVVQIAGRAPSNIIIGLYFIWGIWTLAALRPRLPRVPVALYLALLGAFALSVVGAEDPGRAARKFLKFTAHSSVFLFTLMAFQSGGCMERVVRTAFGAGVAVLAVLYALLPFVMSQPGYEPTTSLREDNLPWLLPFLAAGMVTLYRKEIRTRWALAMILATLSASYVVLSDGRSALLGMVVAIVVWTSLVFRTRWLPIAAAVALFGTFHVVWGDRFYRHAPEYLDQGWFAVVDRLTNRRLTLWAFAVDQPPERLATGVGLGNLKRLGLVAFEGTPRAMEVKGFHNVLLDTWYETGFIGLGALLVFVLVGLARLWRCAASTKGNERVWHVTCLAASLAILTSAQFSISLFSLPFSIYLFMILAVAWGVGEGGWSGGRPDQGREELENHGDRGSSRPAAGGLDACGRLAVVSAEDSGVPGDMAGGQRGDRRAQVFQQRRQTVVHRCCQCLGLFVETLPQTRRGGRAPDAQGPLEERILARALDRLEGALSLAAQTAHRCGSC